MNKESAHIKSSSLDALFWKEEILQVLYWLHGEELEETVPISRLQTLLNTDIDNLMYHLQLSIEAGYLQLISGYLDESSEIKLSPQGKKGGWQIIRICV